MCVLYTFSLCIFLFLCNSVFIVNTFCSSILEEIKVYLASYFTDKIREDSVNIGMDYQKSKYSEDTDIDDVNDINQTCRFLVEACLQLSRDRLRHRYLLTSESMRRMLKALVNNRSNIIALSCKQTMLLYFRR